MWTILVVLESEIFNMIGRLNKPTANKRHLNTSPVVSLDVFKIFNMKPKISTHGPFTPAPLHF